MPELVAGRRHLLKLKCDGLKVPLEVVLDVPPLPAEGKRSHDGPLKVVLYFHGAGEDSRNAPNSTENCAVVAPQCPEFFAGKQHCFWFQQGPPGAWDRHDHSRLRRCHVMLNAVGEVVDKAVTALKQLRAGFDVESKVRIMGCSMGAHAALEFTRTFPTRVRSAAVCAGYYDNAKVEQLANATSAVTTRVRLRQRPLHRGMVHRWPTARSYRRRAVGDHAVVAEMAMSV